MSRIFRGLSVAVAVVLLSVPSLADNGTILRFKKGNNSSLKTVSTSDVITFTSGGIRISSQQPQSFDSFDLIEFSADRGAITVLPGQSGSTPVGTTMVDISFPGTEYADVVDLGPGEGTPTPGPDDPPTPPTPVTYDLNEAVITVTGSYVYTGQPIIPEFTVTCGGVTLTQGTDYSTEFFYNDQTGRAFIVVNAIAGSHYDGSQMQVFNIAPRDLSDATVTLETTTFDYSGVPIMPAFTVVVDGRTLTADDYEVKYSNNENPGTATITITGMGNYTGSATTTFDIKKRPLVLALDGETISPTFNPNGTIAFYTGTYGSAYVTGYSVAIGDTVTVTVTPAEGYLVGSFQLSGGLEYKEVPGTGTTMRYKYAEPVDEVTISIVFNQDLTAVRGVAADALRFTVIDDRTVRITGAEETAKVTVFDARGQQVGADVLRSENILLVRLARQPQGLYIIKVNNNTFKIYKK